MREVTPLETTDGIMKRFLRGSEILDFHAPSVSALAESLRKSDLVETARRCFEWVRDEVRHSLDHGDEQVTLKASEVLRERTGLCYSKSHLLAALLRANGIPCGLIYQRLELDESGEAFCLHGLNAIWLLEHGWYRVDARGDLAGITTCFDPPRESLAFTAHLPGEGMGASVYAEPLPVIVDTLRRHTSLRYLLKDLPDANLDLLSAQEES